jgi:hypothetical protein
MGVRVEWYEAKHTSVSVFPPGNDDWVGSDDQGDDWVLTLSVDEVGAIHGTREELMAIAESIREALTPEPPELVIVDRGDYKTLACPHEGCDGDEVYEVDRAERWNPAVHDEDDLGSVLIVHQGHDGDGYQTVGWICQTCTKPVTLPNDLATEWT